MPKLTRLEPIENAILERLRAGETLCWLDVWRSTDEGSRSWAHACMKRWHTAGLVHIAEYRRGSSGPAVPYYRFGAGQDAARPKALTTAQKCKRWRKAHPEMVKLATKRATFRERKTPIMDPITAALCGYRRHGSGWVKREANHATNAA